MKVITKVAHTDKLQMLERMRLEDYLSQSSGTHKNKKEKERKERTSFLSKHTVCNLLPLN
jgi:hypothetical protein